MLCLPPSKSLCAQLCVLCVLQRKRKSFVSFDHIFATTVVRGCEGYSRMSMMVMMRNDDVTSGLLSKIASPDGGVQTAADLGVGRAGEDIGVTSLAAVVPTLGSRVAD